MAVARRKMLDLSLNPHWIVYCLVLQTALKTVSSFKWSVRIIIIRTSRRFIGVFPEITSNYSRYFLWAVMDGECGLDSTRQFVRPKHCTWEMPRRQNMLASNRKGIELKKIKNYYLHCTSLNITHSYFSTVLSGYRVFKHRYIALKSGITNFNINLQLNPVITTSVYATPRL
jgi:hypothetical protein